MPWGHPADYFSTLEICAASKKPLKKRKENEIDYRDIFMVKWRKPGGIRGKEKRLIVTARKT